VVSSYGIGGFYHQCNGVVVPEARPVLMVSPSPVALVLQWPTSAVNFVLEWASGLSPPAQWEPVTEGIVMSNGMYWASVEYESASRFFRLRRP
jgi:hypothetical protein